MKSRPGWARIPSRTAAWVLSAVCGASLLTGDWAAADPALEFSSGRNQVALIELYTSEGCSSCPPADRWFSELKRDDGLWREFVPLAFHVDYWDYIGWHDRFASPENSARQRRYARAGGVSTVYTPGFIVNGQEWRGWFRGRKRPVSRATAGDLRARLSDNDVTVRFSPANDADSYVANVALLGTNLASEVSAGENRGRQLVHDFVVVAHARAPLDRNETVYTGALKLDPPAGPGRRATAIAVWVTTGRQLTPLQATGAWLLSARENARPAPGRR